MGVPFFAPKLSNLAFYQGIIEYLHVVIFKNDEIKA